MTDDEREALEPAEVACTDSELTVTLASGRKVATRLPWCLHAIAVQRAVYEVSVPGVHWPEIDEDPSVEGMLLGCKASGGREPEAA